MRLAVDTNILSAYFKSEGSVVELIARCPVIHLPIIVRAEMMAGFQGGARPYENIRLFEEFVEEANVEMLHVTTQTTDIYARIHAALRKKGRPIPVNDLWIAALCLQYDCTLLTRDSDFEAVSLLSVLKP